jgi:hypothetical protein
MSNQTRRGFLREKLKTKTIILNTIAEFIASTIFSALYFIFISRYLSETFHTDYILLSFCIGLAFFAAVYIPFHTYRIHIIPFITLVTALRKKKPIILLHKIPVQILGAFTGVLIFNSINSITTKINIDDFQLVKLDDTWLILAINSITAAFLCYVFYMIRVLFNSRQLAGTIYLSLFYAALFAMTSFFANVSSLNPFGYFFYDLLGGQIMKTQSFLPFISIHVVAPIVAVLMVYFTLIQSKYKTK